MDNELAKKMEQIDELRDRIKVMLTREFNEEEVKVVLKVMNELIELEIEVEQECNQ